MKAELYGIAYGFADSYLVSYNTSTWEQAGYKYISYDPKYVALETAQDQTTHTVYGEFYTGGSNYELGTIDYTTSPVTRTTIKSTYTLYAALGISSDGYLYGIASDGNLYKIDKTDGTETLVGNTGITIADENGQFSQQSGEIDQTTNTFYWASLDKDGNAALYTVDLQDAHVEKITDLETNEQILRQPPLQSLLHWHFLHSSFSTLPSLRNSIITGLLYTSSTLSKSEKSPIFHLSVT